MRYLNKHIPCKRLKQKLKNPPVNEVSAKRAWRRFNKKDTRKACYKLQQGLCAYTELSLDSELLGSHLEHIAPRSRFPDRTFMADNLVLSVLSDEYAGTLSAEDRFAGHYKKSHYEDEWFVSPYNEGCEGYFYYCSETGLVFPMQTLDDSAQYKAVQTISALNLNCDYLVKRRLAALEPLKQKINTIQTMVTETITTPEVAPSLLLSHATQNENCDLRLALKQLTEKSLIATNRKLPEFYTAKKQLFERYMPQAHLLPANDVDRLPLPS